MASACWLRVTVYSMPASASLSESLDLPVRSLTATNALSTVQLIFQSAVVTES